MSRNSKITPPTKFTKKKRDEITETRKYKLITPLYGGGVEPEKADPITVVRASEVRGHLRFWWRATRGGAFDGSLKKMREREEEIFGSAAGEGKAGQSQLSVTILEATKGRQPKSVTALDDEGLGYAAFPLRDSNGSVEENVNFTLQLTYPSNEQKEIEAALWAWETFGGIGARTRRGFGALQRIDRGIPDNLTVRDAKTWIADQLSEYIEAENWPENVPHLSASLLYKVTSRQDDGIESWKHLIAALQSFRQTNARYDKESGEKSNYGMSLWPEPNEVRRYFGRNPALPLGVNKSDLVQKMPRAQFGLPIILHMAHDDGLKDKEIKLEGREHDRLASPLILRPLICKDGAVGVALVLNTPREPLTPSGLVLKGAPNDPPVDSDLKPTDAKKIPMLNGEKDILKAFLDYLN